MPHAPIEAVSVVAGRKIYSSADDHHVYSQQLLTDMVAGVSVPIRYGEAAIGFAQGFHHANGVITADLVVPVSISDSLNAGALCLRPLFHERVNSRTGTVSRVRLKELILDGVAVHARNLLPSVPIFQEGEWNDRQWDAQDLSDTARNYEHDGRPPIPLVFSHTSTMLGYADNVRHKHNRLIADFHLDDDTYAGIERNRWSTVSCQHQWRNDPWPSYYLLHVGILPRGQPAAVYTLPLLKATLMRSKQTGTVKTFGHRPGYDAVIIPKIPILVAGYYQPTDFTEMQRAFVAKACGPVPLNIAPKETDPTSHGWLDALEPRGRTLFADIGVTDEQLMKDLLDGRYSYLEPTVELVKRDGHTFPRCVTAVSLIDNDHSRNDLLPFAGKQLRNLNPDDIQPRGIT